MEYTHTHTHTHTQWFRTQDAFLILKQLCLGGLIKITLGNLVRQSGHRELETITWCLVRKAIM